MGLFGKKGPYSGPVCWIPFDHKGPDGKDLKGGWHYSVKIHRKFGEVPDKPLHLNDVGAPFYEYAEPHHQSWVEKHGEGNIVNLRGA